MSTKYHHALKPGSVISNFRITSLLGVGGFGITYQAFDENLERDVAIKEFFPSSLALRDDDGLTITTRFDSDRESYDYGLQRFLDEAKTLAKFQHPSIVRVSQFIKANGTAYFVMDYEAGESLYLRLKKQVTMDERECLDMVVPLLEGLAEVHEQNYLHRDIKPGNIFMCNDGRPVLLDFGSARQAIQDREMTAIVSPGYAPYEQYFSKQNQGPWTDLYAIGATLFLAITGIKPTPALDRMNEIKRGKADPIELLMEQANVEISPEFQQVLFNLLAPKPEKRPQSAVDVLQDFKSMCRAHDDDEIQWDDDFLKAVEAVLKEKKVRRAHSLVDKASKKAHSVNEIAGMLAESMKSDDDKTEIREKTVLLANQPQQEKQSYADPSAALPLFEILRRTQLVLASIIGPDAEHRVAAVARKAETREDFYKLLLDDLHDKSLRQEFILGVREFDTAVELNL